VPTGTGFHPSLQQKRLSDDAVDRRIEISEQQPGEF
jgi:hypothetical protein